ncbi:hypothetical protein ACMGD3_04230 [Lysinibacillus sphaericus]|uniref:hypothetical protein n=1 Tax=Lysinibacillus sphaericus TaxID=1421 RepID=UPI003F79C91E
MVTLVFLMSGCSDSDSYSFSGSGESWEVVYDVVVTNETDQQTAGTIKYIGDDKAPETIDYKIKYNGLGQGSWDEESSLKFGAVKFKDVTCGNCEIIQKDDEIEVEIIWGEQTEKLILTTDK